MVQNLEGMGFTIVPFGQGFKDMSPLSWDLTVRSAVEIIQALLSMMTEKFYSYKNGALVFTQKAPLLFIYLNL